MLVRLGSHDHVIYGTARMISHEPLYYMLSRVLIAEAIGGAGQSPSLSLPFSASCPFCG
jgi:hypothetical protein